MQTVLPSELKPAMVVMIEGAPHYVEASHLSGTAQTKHKLHTRLRHFRTGRIIDRVFAENERIPIAELEQRDVQFSYQQRDSLVFMESRSYEEVMLPVEQLGERRGFIKENEEYRAVFLDGKLLDIILPAQVSLEVIATDPGQKRGSDSTWKPAKVEGGAEIMVPLFIETGDVIRIDTSTRKYLGKETGNKPGRNKGQ
jgi:elongation factor P